MGDSEHNKVDSCQRPSSNPADEGDNAMAAAEWPPNCHERSPSLTQQAWPLNVQEAQKRARESDDIGMTKAEAARWLSQITTRSRSQSPPNDCGDSSDLHCSYRAGIASAREVFDSAPNERCTVDNTAAVTEMPSMEHKGASCPCKARNNHIVCDGHPCPESTLEKCVMPRDGSSPRSVDSDTLTRLEVPKMHGATASRPPPLFPDSCSTREETSSQGELTSSSGGVTLGTSELRCYVDQCQAALGSGGSAHAAENAAGIQSKQGNEVMPSRRFAVGALTPPLRLKIPSLSINKHGRVVAGEVRDSKPGAQNEDGQMSLHQYEEKAANATQSKLTSLRNSLNDDEWIQVSFLQHNFHRYCDISTTLKLDRAQALIRVSAEDCRIL